MVTPDLPKSDLSSVNKSGIHFAQTFFTYFGIILLNTWKYGLKLRTFDISTKIPHSSGVAFDFSDFEPITMLVLANKAGEIGKNRFFQHFSQNDNLQFIFRFLVLGSLGPIGFKLKSADIYT